MAASAIPFSIDQESISGSRVIICEGGGDKNFFRELIKARGLPDFYVTHPFDKIHPGGRQGYAARLRALRLQPDFDQVAGVLVVSDNDRDPRASFAEVRSLVHDAGFTAPNRPSTVAAGTPSVIIMMLPAPDQEGQLETICLEAIKSTWPRQFECAEQYAECAGIATWGIAKQERAKLRALISHICKKDPNTSLSHLWHDGREIVVPLDSESFDPVVESLRQFAAAFSGS